MTPTADLHPAPPGPAGVLHASDLTHAEQAPLQFLLDMTRGYGDISRYETAVTTTYLVNSPEHIAHVMRSPNFPRGVLLTLVLGQGLISSEDDWWRKQRTLMLPDFHPRVIRHFADSINSVARTHLQRWREYSAHGEVIDLADELLHLTLQVIVQVLFSGDLLGERETFYQSVKVLLSDMGDLMKSGFVATTALDPDRNRRVFQTLARMDELVYAAIAARRAHDDKEDLLSLLLGTRDETGKGLSDLEIRDEIVTMIFAGNETTATALSWTCFILATMPEIASQVRAESAGVLDGREATLEDLTRLPFLKMTLDETMRLYPPVWSIPRKVRNTEIVGGYRLEGGHALLVSPYAMHRHPQFWPDPERFDPLRFSAEQIAARPRRAYLPFGAGRHICVGQRLAQMEMYLVLTQIAQCFELHLEAGARIEPEPLVTLRLKYGLPVTHRSAPGRRASTRRVNLCATSFR